MKHRLGQRQGRAFKVAAEDTGLPAFACCFCLKRFGLGFQLPHGCCLQTTQTLRLREVEEALTQAISKPSAQKL